MNPFNSRQLVTIIVFGISMFLVPACSDSNPQSTIPDIATESVVSKPNPTAIPSKEPTPEPPDMLFRYITAVQQLNAAQYKEAISSFDMVIRVLPDLTKAYLYRAIAHHKEKQTELALEDLDKAISIKSDFADAYRYRAIINSESGDFRLALTDLENALQFYNEQGDTRGAVEIQQMIRQSLEPQP